MFWGDWVLGLTIAGNGAIYLLSPTIGKSLMVLEAASGAGVLGGIAGGYYNAKLWSFLAAKSLESGPPGNDSARLGLWMIISTGAGIFGAVVGMTGGFFGTLYLLKNELGI